MRVAFPRHRCYWLSHIDALITPRLVGNVFGSRAYACGYWYLWIARMPRQRAQTGNRRADCTGSTEESGVVPDPKARNSFHSGGYLAWNCGGAALTKYLQTMLFGVSALDASMFVLVSVLFMVVAVIASFLPARQAAVIEPVQAIRYE